MPSQEKRIDEQQAVAHLEQQLSESTEQFITAGGFDLLEGVIDEVQNLNPERRARKKIFLNEASKKADRQDLLKRMKV